MSEKVDKDRNWQWLSKSDLITETEASDVLHWDRPSGQTMKSPTSIRPVKIPCADYMGKIVKVCNS